MLLCNDILHKCASGLRHIIQLIQSGLTGMAGQEHQGDRSPLVTFGNQRNVGIKWD